MVLIQVSLNVIAALIFRCQTCCLGEGWVAVATDRRMLRLFTLGGIQREIISLPGPVVAMAGHLNQLLVAYHSGMGKVEFLSMHGL